LSAEAIGDADTANVMGGGPGDVLFVYGTLIRAGLRRRLLGRRVEARPARLPGFERRRRRHFYIMRRAGATTAGMLLFGLGERDLRVLDEYEQVPHLYRRKRLEAVDGNGRAQSCWVYLPTAWAER
jgi:gamma-glutamylcyclotransferase (GGCT)/AIG2-like uncharacterized protein YtfP